MLPVSSDDAGAGSLPGLVVLRRSMVVERMTAMCKRFCGGNHRISLTGLIDICSTVDCLEIVQTKDEAESRRLSRRNSG
jgi:hypothetical protein